MVEMDRRKVAVTLVCAAADEAVVEAVVLGLRARGRDVALIVGVDEEPRRVAEGVERSAAGLVVACESANLDGPAMRKVEGVFSARRGPKHGFVRLDISQRTHAMIAGVERAIAGFGRSHGQVRRRPTVDLHLREIVQLDESSNIALPVVRLAASEALDGDTGRIEAPVRSRASFESRAGAHEEEPVHPASTIELALRAAPLSAADKQRERLLVVLVICAGTAAILAALL
ncbi:hypothetical protein G6O69_14310 [Pseudenhygromyxa sp. WMMC2535]|uniref:hypothetical protein n=1 Tax=Pseudenhygromyxa sp. WMMC2535 TaxID=2712867 RepID=UPI001595432B|nr:hypothetical protein [Pseudenhygromyxa sp. WMMC2535]NVB39012.1 hypothetical protein [Pseudenhygromyxa sp. WMMC2535]